MVVWFLKNAAGMIVFADHPTPNEYTTNVETEANIVSSITTCFELREIPEYSGIITGGLICVVYYF